MMNDNIRSPRLRPALIGSAFALLAVLAVAVVIAVRPGDAAAQRDPNARSADSNAVADATRRDTDCMSLVRDAYGHLTVPSGPDSVCSFTCHAVSEVATTKGPRTSEADIEYLTGPNRLQITSTLFSVFRDSQDVFTVVPATGSVYRTEARAVDRIGTPQATILGLRDTLLRRCSVMECRDSSDARGVCYRLVHLRPDALASRSFEIEDLHLVIDISRRELRRIVMVPTAGAAYRRLAWTFSPVRIAAAVDSTRRGVAAQFVTSAGKLVPAWSRCRLVDMRTLAADQRSGAR